MSALISGSVAYDSIMVFQDQFKNHILPDKVHMLSVSFLVPEMRKEFGGCAGNIAFNLKLLGGDPLPMATVGKDFGPYGDWMDKLGINRRHVTVIENEFTAQCFITTDLDDNQIAAFHPGAMGVAHVNDVGDAEGADIAIVSPDAPRAMFDHAAQCVDNDIPFIFDPGQQLPMLNGDELRQFIDQATWLAVNDYEWSLIEDKTSMSLQEAISKVKALIVTKGGEGSTIYAEGKEFGIEAAKPEALLDPTGCGDAYRAGLLYGLTNDMDWDTTARIASLMGAYKIEKAGTQNHSFEMSDFEARFKENFGREI